MPKVSKLYVYYYFFILSEDPWILFFVTLVIKGSMDLPII